MNAPLRTICMSLSPTMRFACATLLALSLCACKDSDNLPPAAGTGANPTLPAPERSLIPTVNIAPATGWPDGVKPTPAAGLAVHAYASKLDHPRWLYVLPNGDVLVAESNAPRKPEDSLGIKDWIINKVMQRAGAATRSADRITLLRGVDANGAAQIRSIFLRGLHSPFGMALVGNDLYVANTDAIMRFPYHEDQTSIIAAGEKVADLPAGPINHHWTKNIIASPDGRYLYVSVGSNSNVGENGMENEVNRAAILEFERASGHLRLFASGLRNPNGMDWQPQSGALWTVVNERDELGNDLVPDYLTSVQDGAFYGWPYSYYGQHVDTRVKPPRPDLVAKAIAPDYALGSHVAPLGLAFYDASLLPQYKHGAIIGLHGSWNRTPHSGYKVIYVPFADGKPAGMPEDMLSGFLSPEGKAYGRPVGVAVDRAGAVLVADDVGNVIWRVTPAATK